MYLNRYYFNWKHTKQKSFNERPEKLSIYLEITQEKDNIKWRSEMIKCIRDRGPFHRWTANKTSGHITDIMMSSMNSLLHPLPWGPSRYNDDVFQHRNSHYKDMAVSWLSYRYNRNPHTWKIFIILKQGPYSWDEIMCPSPQHCWGKCGFKSLIGTKKKHNCHL